MKKILGVFSIAAVVAACNSTPSATDIAAAQQTAPAVTLDTAGLAQFQAWKAQNELAQFNPYMNGQEQVQQATPAVTRSAAPARTTTRSSSGTRSSGTRSSGTTSGTSSGSTAGTTQKTGMSKAAKGAVIGGVAGGAAGAVINKKNRVAGGVVGAVIGAGGGYVIGRQMDKKDGRY